MATTPKRTKRSKRSTARIFWAALWSSTKRVLSVKAAVPAADVAATVAEAVLVVDVAVTAAEVVAAAVEDAAAVTVVAAEVAAAIANSLR